MNREDVKAWMAESVTVEFMKRVHWLREDCDEQVHGSLHVGNTEEAKAFEAGRVQLAEVLLIPDLMLEEIKEKVNEKQNTG